MRLVFFRSTTCVIAFLAFRLFFKIFGFFSNPESHIIRSDGIGYYSYLPAIFIYHDLSHSFLKDTIAKYYDVDEATPNIKTVYGKKVNKYFAGTSILMSPFFALAHLTALCSHYAPDGYSLPYQYAIGIAAIFYLCLGCWFVQKLLFIYESSFWKISFITFCIVFGTNLSHNAVSEPSLSHAYSFACMTAFLFYMKRYLLSYKKRDVGISIVLFALICLIRPVNALIVLAIPFLSGSWRSLKEGFHEMYRNKRHFMLPLVIAFLIVAYQVDIWYLETGHLMIWSYTGERFIFTRPEMINVLFSYRKGLFIWTPLSFISLAGFIYLFRNNRFAFYTLFGFFFLLIYVISSWWTWEYGMGFGCRPIVDYYALVALLLCFTLKLMKSVVMNAALVVLMFLTVALDQVQDYQYRTFILHWSDMDRSKYWKVFLKTDDKWMGYLWNNKFYDEETLSVPVFNPDNEKIKFAEWINSVKEKSNASQAEPESFPFLQQIGRARITLKTAKGLYVCADKSRHRLLFADRSKADIWETFTILLFKEDMVFLKSFENKFVSSDKALSSHLIADRNQGSFWEFFNLVKIKDDQYALKDWRSKYVTFPDNPEDPLIASADAVNEKTLFTIELSR